MPTRPAPTAAEMRILKIVWERGPCATRDVVATAQAENEWSTSTVKTLLRRLVEKGQLRARRVGNSFQYEPRRSPLQSLRQAADSLLDHATAGTVGSLLAYMLRRSELSEEELHELRGLLEEKDAEEGDRP